MMGAYSIAVVVNMGFLVLLRKDDGLKVKKISVIMYSGGVLWENGNYDKKLVVVKT